MPDFFCLGAQKCGSTTLWRILDEHPDVYMARPRETRFFCDDFQYFSGLAWYESRYFPARAGASAAGEKCPEYLYAPEAADRIYKSLGPDVRFITALRSPAQRAFSHYRHNMAMLRECRSFEEALENEAALLASGGMAPIPFGYLGRGLYSLQLERYLNHYPPENILLISFDKEIAGDQTQTARRVQDFLGLEPRPLGFPYSEGRPPLDLMSITVEDGSRPRRERIVKITRRRPAVKSSRSFRSWFSVKKRWFVRSEIQEIKNPSEAMIHFVDKFNKNRPRINALPRDMELEINRRHFSRDIEKLSGLTGFEPEGWLG